MAGFSPGVDVMEYIVEPDLAPAVDDSLKVVRPEYEAVSVGYHARPISISSGTGWRADADAWGEGCVGCGWLGLDKGVFEVVRGWWDARGVGCEPREEEHGDEGEVRQGEDEDREG